ncbi:hypothetical protein HDV00_001105 [Rhizophlyctis rosea]|nr:hypothetical protein HDV00_001105 [Rhizophlyctis rosea]
MSTRPHLPPAAEPTNLEVDTDCRPPTLHKLPFTLLCRCVLKAFFSGYAIAALPSLTRLFLRLSPIFSRKRRRISPLLLSHEIKKILLGSFKDRLPWFLLVLVAGFRVLDSLFWAIAVAYRRKFGRVATTLRELEGSPGRIRKDIKETTAKVLRNLDHELAREQLRRDLESVRNEAKGEGEQSLTTTNEDELPENEEENIVTRPINRPIRINPTFLAGTISSALALLTLEPDRRSDFAVFTAIRALDSFISLHYPTVKPKLHRYLPAGLLDNMDTLVFALCSMEIMFSWVYVPQALPRTYVKWITKMSNMDPRLLRAKRLFRSGELKYGDRVGDPGFLMDLAEELGLERRFGDPANGLIPCVVAHGGVEGCVEHKGVVWRRGFLDALKVYIPGHILPALLFHRRRLLHYPIQTLRHVLISILRSSAFLASYITVLWTFICLCRNSIGRDTIAGPILGSFGSGLTLLLEKKERRREVAVYCVPKAVESCVWRVTGGKGVGGKWAGVGEVGGFAVAMGYLLKEFVKGPKRVRREIGGLLGFFLV